MSTRRTFEVVIPDGQHLGWSRDTAGAFRAHLFDDATGVLTGHAELFEPVPDVDTGVGVDRDRELEEALGALVVLGIVVAAQHAAPHVRSWWTGTVRPALDSFRDAISERWDQVRHRSATVEEADGRAFEATPVVISRTPVGASADTPVMSSDEARRRFAAYLVASSFADEQERLLRHARISDDGAAEAHVSAIAWVDPEDVHEAIVSLLADHPGLLEQSNLYRLGPALEELMAGRVAGVPGLTGTVAPALDARPARPTSDDDTCP